MIETLLKSLQGDQFARMLEMERADPDAAEFINLFDFENLPPKEDIIKHLAPSAAVGLILPDGILLTGSQPARP
jgi:hypothetical protein